MNFKLTSEKSGCVSIETWKKLFRIQIKNLAIESLFIFLLILIIAFFAGGIEGVIFMVIPSIFTSYALYLLRLKKIIPKELIYSFLKSGYYKPHKSKNIMSDPKQSLNPANSSYKFLQHKPWN